MSLEVLQKTPVGDLFEGRTSLSEEDRVTKAIGQLRESGEYEVFVAKGKRVSTATTRDLISVNNPQSTKLGSVAYFAPELNEKDDIGKAARIMFDYRLRALPVSAQGTAVQAVSLRGIAQRMADSPGLKAKASDLMTAHPITVRPDDDVLKARQIMLRRSIDHLPSLDDGRKVSGMLTSSHILFNLLPEGRSPGQTLSGVSAVRFDYPVKRIMDESSLTVEADTGVAEIIDLMLKRRSSYVLVTLWSELQGIITLRDVVKLIVRRERNKVPFYIVGLPDDPFESEAAKMKFQRLAESLVKAFPFIQEVRAVIKSKPINSSRRRYELQVSLYSPRDRYAYSEQGYELPDLFDAVSPKLKRLLSSRQSKVTRSRGASLRKMT